MRFEFGEYRLDATARELHRGCEALRIEPKVLDLLVLLVRQRGRVVSRAAVEHALWPDTSVSRSALSRLVKEARRVLGDDGRGQRWIETRRGRGFRFAPAVRERGGSLADLPYVGRAALLRRLDRLLDDASRGRGQVLLVTGEPGVGKTRTAEELVERARLRDAQVATAWSSEITGAPSYWPWIQLLRELCADVDAESLRARLGPSADVLARLLPELRNRPGATGPAIAGEHERFRLFDGVRGFLHRSARDAPIVLILDDLHWADAESIELLEFLCHDRTTPILALATYREPELERQARHARLVSRLAARPDVERWPLDAFTKQETRAFIEACTAREPAPALVELLFGRSDGNPLFLCEILRAAAREGVLERPPESWDALAPSGLERFIEARVRSLSAATRRALSRAAAIGREFEEGLLASASGLPGDAVRAAIEEGERARVVVRAPARAGRHRFTHALVRDALHAELAADERAEVHARIATALELAGTGEADPDIVAHHCFAAIPVLGAERAIEACARAGEHALSLNAFDVAVRQLGRALDLLAPGADASSRRRCALLLQLGEARRSLGDVAGSREAFGQAGELASARGDAALVAHAALGFAGLYAYGAPDPAATERLERAADGLGPEHEALRARLLGRLASELMLDPDTRRRAALRRRAWAAAGNGGDLAAIVEIAAHPDHGIWDTMVPPCERLALTRSYVARCAERGLALSELAARVMMLDELLRLGRMEAFDVLAPAVDALGAEIRDPRLLWVRMLQGFSRELVRGDFDAAEGCAERARDFGQRHLEPLAPLALWGRQLAVLRAEQGRLGELREPWERAGAGAGTPSNRALHAWICAADGDRARAREIAAPLLAGGAAPLVSEEPMACANAAVLAEVCVFLGESGSAERLLAVLRPYAGMNALRTYAACHGPVDHYRGLLESLRGREDAAEHHQREALDLAERMGSPCFAARCRAALRALRAA